MDALTALAQLALELATAAQERDQAQGQARQLQAKVAEQAGRIKELEDAAVAPKAGSNGRAKAPSRTVK